ncbi:cilia- and flagella-associated protein 299 [Chanos chanos]|uniref:Cilia- and flagella-associated protein 299 n=1 Tax=Chanos chanos TaxID=29144 RepID=A0A6J2UP17_CHACN|nr:cilia- and flagella-associated protein 299 [Chanos chanos]
MDAKDSAAPRDRDIVQFQTYEDYLDSKITPLDLYYLEDEELARQLIELGYRGSSGVLKREEFEAQRVAEQAARLSKTNQPKTLASAGKELKDNFLRALAGREEANLSGKRTSIIFIRDRTGLGQEISGYIDYSHRLRTEDFEPYFSGKKKLLPKPSDLSFYNWETQVATSNDSANWEVITTNPNGLLFRVKHGRKILNVDPEVSPGDNFSRTPIQTDLYTQVVIYDSVVPRLGA